MGKKKLEIREIDNKKEKGICFSRRSKGLLKKASELGTLCGINISLIFTDLNEGVHYFSNHPHIKMKANRKFTNNKEDFPFYTYNQEDYPFEKFKKKDKEVAGICLSLLEETKNVMKKKGWAELRGLDKNIEWERPKHKFMNLVKHFLKSNEDLEEEIINEEDQTSMKTHLDEFLAPNILFLPSPKLKEFLYKDLHIYFQSKQSQKLGANGHTEKMVDSQKTQGLGDDTASLLSNSLLSCPSHLEEKYKDFNSYVDGLFFKGKCNYLPELLSLRCLVSLYFRKSPTTCSSSLIKSIPQSEILKIVDIKEGGFFNSPLEKVEFVDFSDTLSTGSKFSFESGSFTQENDEHEQKDSKSNHQNVIYRSHGHPIDGIEEHFVKKVVVLNHLLLGVIMRKIEITKDFDLSRIAGEIKSPSYFFRFKNKIQQNMAFLFSRVWLEFNKDHPELSKLFFPFFGKEDPTNPKKKGGAPHHHHHHHHHPFRHPSCDRKRPGLQFGLNGGGHFGGRKHGPGGFPKKLRNKILMKPTMLMVIRTFQHLQIENLATSASAQEIIQDKFKLILKGRARMEQGEWNNQF